MPINPIKGTHVDVLVVGAGPAGLFASHALAKAGVNVKVIDQKPVKVMAGHADGLQPSTLEVLQSYGLLDKLLREGNQLHMAAFYKPSPNGGIELKERVPDTSASTARYPFEFTLHQGAIESNFIDSMADRGVTVGRPFVPTSIEFSQDEKLLKDPNAHPIKVVLKNLEPMKGQADTEVVYAKFVIGADGAHSWVRKNLGIAMEGEQTDIIWGVVDLTTETDFPDMRKKSVIHSENDSCLIIPREKDILRIYVQLDDRAAIDVNSRRVDKTRVEPLKIFEIAKRAMAPYKIETPESFLWWTLYTIGQRVASKFSVHERAFIVGDACHTHSPKAGQGMNAGMNDSHNLVWKIVYALRGWADMSLLKTYELERRKYAQDLIDFDRDWAKYFYQKEETQDETFQKAFVDAFQKFSGFTTGIGIRYAESTIVRNVHQSQASNLTIGQRVLPRIFLRAADGRPFEIQDLLPSDTRFKVLIFTGDSTNAGQRVKLNKLAAEMKAIMVTYALSSDVCKVFNILAISSAKKETVEYNELPEFFRPHWSKVLVDDVDTRGTLGGGGYEYYGIDPKEGAVVVVRPDGYIGLILPFGCVQELDDYFSAFMVKV